MNEELFETLSWISSYLAIVPLLVVFIRWKKLTVTQFKLAILLFLMLLVEIISNVLWYDSDNNLSLYHFYSVIEFLVILSLFSSFLRDWISKKWFVALGAAFTLFAIVNTLFFQGFEKFNSNVTTLSAFLVILLTLFTYFTFLQRTNEQAVSRSPAFWINTGLFLYFSTSLVLFYITTKVEITYDESFTIWGLHSIFNIIQITLFTLALWIRPKKD